MKTLKKSQIKTALIVWLSLLSAVPVLAQNKANDKGINVQNMLTAKRYIFVAQTAIPTGGPTRQLTSDFDVKVSGDTLQSYLPYFGRAYSAPIGPDEGGLQFTSTQFNYNVQQKKKGWDVVIVPKDTKDVRQLLLQVSSGGYASLVVTSNNRQTISFRGYLAENTKRK